MDQEGRIRKYWHGKLSEQEGEALETEMRFDAELKQEVQSFRDLQLAIGAAERQALKEKLSALPRVQPRRRQLWPLAAAAAVLLLLGMAWLYRQSAVVAPVELFASYYEPYPNVAHPIVRQQEQAGQETLAFVAYEQGNYSEAIERLEQLLTTEDHPEWRFYLAVSLVSQGDYEAAQVQFAQLSDADFRFRSPVLWYQALLSLREEDTATARTLLLQLQQADPEFEKAAVERLLKYTSEW
mgnify:CR=1 FL=1